MAFWRSKITGFVYVAEEEEGAMRAAARGATIRNPDRQPPWIVVVHTIERVIAARWPGKLWRVRVLREAPEQPVDTAGYTRATAVEVIEEEPVSRLFGAHGDEVCRVLESAARFGADDLVTLGRNSEAAGAAYSRAWNRWLESTDGETIDRGGSHAHTLAIHGGRAPSPSPIGIGLTVVYDVVSRRAHGLAGDAAFTVDEDDNQWLAPGWDNAAYAFLHAAMALGAPELVPPDDAAILTAAWEEYAGV